MASLEEAFAKLDMWKNSQTPLKVTVVTNGGIPEILRGQILSTDSVEGLVGLFVTKDRRYPRLDIRGASFRMGTRFLEATREDDLLTFEDIS